MSFVILICVKIRANIHMNDVSFNHIVEHALSCTLEEDSKDVSSCVGLRFETINEMFNMKQKRLH